MRVDLDSIEDIYKNLWNDSWHKNIYIASDKRDTSYYYSIGFNCLKNYFDFYKPNFDQDVIGIEKKLYFDLGRYKFVGIIDRLDISNDGFIEVHDYKTSKFHKTQRQAKNDLQLGLYYLAVEQNYSNKNISLNWHFLNSGLQKSQSKIISIWNDKLDDKEKKIDHWRSQLISKVDEKLDVLNKEEIFSPLQRQAQKLCDWCYLWEECRGKKEQGQSSNPLVPVINSNQYINTL